MTTTIAPQPTLTYEWQGQKVTDSKRIADLFGRSHFDVLRTIMSHEKRNNAVFHWTTTKVKGRSIKVAIIDREAFDHVLLRNLSKSQMKLKERIANELGEPIEKPQETQMYCTVKPVDMEPFTGHMTRKDRKLRRKQQREQEREQERKHRNPEQLKPEPEKPIEPVMPGLFDEPQTWDFTPDSKSDPTDTIFIEALMEMPDPQVSAGTKELAKSCILMRKAHDHIMNIYKETYNVSNEEEDKVTEALCAYFSLLTTNFVSKYLHGVINEWDWMRV